MLAANLGVSLVGSFYLSYGRDFEGAMDVRSHLSVCHPWLMRFIMLNLKRFFFVGRQRCEVQDWREL